MRWIYIGEWHCIADYTFRRYCMVTMPDGITYAYWLTQDNTEHHTTKPGSSPKMTITGKHEVS